MNKRELTRVHGLFASSHKGNTAQRDSKACGAFCYVLPAKARTFVLALVMTAMAFMAAPFVTGDGEAHAYLSEDKTTAVVADFDELKKAVEGSDGYSHVEQIVIDPQAAVDFTDKEDAQIGYDGAFYIPIEQPIRVSREVTITTAEGTEVVFARSAKGGNGDYDSKAFAGANTEWPGFFNVINSRGKLTIEGNIRMTGELVAANFEEGSDKEDPYFVFDVEEKQWSRGNGTGIVDGGFFIHNAVGGEVVINGASNSDEKATENVVFTNLITDNTVKNAAPVYVGGGGKFTMNGGAITGNAFVSTIKDVKDATNAGGIIIDESKTTVSLNDGVISDNTADVAGIIVREGAELNVDEKFVIDENAIYREGAEDEQDAKDAVEETTTEAATQKEAATEAKTGKEEAATEAKTEEDQPTTAAPKTVRKASGFKSGKAATQQRSGGNGATDTTWTVSTSSQLKAALQNTNVSTIIIDEIGAFNEVGITDESGNKNVSIEKTTSNPNKKFYLPVDEPLTIAKGSGNRSVTIKTKDDKEVTIARSELFGTKASNTAPAIFNVPSGVTLTLSSKITMSGDQVKSAYKYKDDAGNDTNNSGYSPGQEAIDSGVFALDGGDFFGIVEKAVGVYVKEDYLGKVSGDATVEGQAAKELSIDSNGFIILTHKDKTCHISRDGKIIEGAPYETAGDWRLKALDSEGNPTEGYVSQLTTGTKYVITAGTNSYTGDVIYVKFNGDSFKAETSFAGAIQFKAAKSVEDASEDQEYEGIKFKFDIEPKTRTSAEVKQGGYFIHATGGGKVVLNSGVLLQGLKTEADVPNAAPVYVGGEGSKLELKGAEIKNNLVGYAGGDESNSSKMVKDYNRYDIEEFVEGTDMTNSVGGIILDNKATAEFTSGKVNSNRADVGAILVKREAELKISGTETGTTINNNVGFHHAGAVQVESGGKVKMTGGTMSNNVAWYKGGAVWATEWGTNGYAKLNWNTKPFPTLENRNDRTEGGYFSMDGGSLKDNMAFKRAGAIEVESNNVYLKSGVISGNTTRSLGGAIYVEGDNTTYTYTLLIENGYIGNNKAVKPGTSGADNNKINRYLDGTGKLTEAVSSNPSSHDHDFTYWGAAGNGGGVWLCPRGGTASFTGQNVIIDNNTKERNGTDLFLQPGYGSVMLQDMKGYWKNENTGNQIATNGVYNGPLPLQNHGESANGPNYSEPSGGLIIKGNLARDGGGIAANGTVIFGSAKDEFRYDARVNIHKTWDNVPVAQRENITIQVGYGDPANDNDFTILDTTLIKGNEDATDSQNIEFTLDGTSGGIGDFSDAVLGETSTGRDADQWSGYVTVPTAINGVALYKFVAPPLSQLTNIPEGKFTNEEITAYNSKTELDPSKPSDLKYLYYIAKYHQDLLQVKAGTSKVKIRETNTKYDKTYNLNLTVDAANTTARPTTLIEPASGTVHGSFDTCFTSISVGLGLTNKMKAVNVSLVKVATDSTNSSDKRWVRGAKFIVVEIQQDTPSMDFRVAGDPGTWNPDASNEIKAKTLLDVAQKDSSGEMAVYTSGVNGVFTIQNLKPDNKYFLFEYEPAAGYVATSSPWIIDVASNGNATVAAVDPEAKYNGQSVINKVVTNRPRNNERLDDFIVKDITNTNNRVWHAYWKNNWFYNENGTAKNPVNNRQIGNSTADIKITKVDNEGEPIKNAVFAFADVGYEPSSEKTKVYYSQAGVIRKDSKYLTVTSDNNGKIDITPAINALDPASNGNAGQGRMESDSIWLWMFEIGVPDNYKQKTAPWLINIAKDKTVKIYEYKNPYVYPRSPIQKNDQGNWVWDNAAVGGNGQSQVRNIPLADFNFSSNAENDRPISTSNGTTDAQVKNNKKIKLTKVDGKTGNTVLGTKFRLYKADMNIEFDENGDLASTGTIGVESIAINEINATDGTVDIGLPDAGTYLLFETQAASGYERRKEPWLIHVNSDGSYRMAIYNYEYLSLYGKRNNEATTDEWHARAIASDAFNSWSKLSSYLDHGKIKYYLKSENKNRFTELDGENEKGKLKNKPMDLRIVKKSSIGNQVLTGVEFDLYNATKEQIDGHWEFQVQDNRINSDGQLVSGADGSFTLPTLEPDHIYMLFEKEPKTGYKKPSAPWGIVVDGDGVVKVWRLKKSGDAGYNSTSIAQYAADDNPSQVVILCTDMIETGSFEIENEPKPIELQKVDENGEAITSGASFVLTKAARFNNSTNWYVFEGRAYSDRTLLDASRIGFGEQSARTYTTNGAGKLQIENLPSGNYLLFETSAPTGFDRTRTPWLITVEDRNTGRTVHVYKIADDHKNEYMDASGTIRTIPEIAGDQQGAHEMYWPGGDTGWFEAIQTNSDGSYNVANEPKYIVKVDSTTVSDEDPVVLADVEFDLYPAFVQTYQGIEVIRRANDSYKITNYEFKSDSKGHIEVPSALTRQATTKRASGYDDDVFIQGYMLVEKQAPNGYKNPVAPWWITVDESGNISVKTTSRAKRGDAGPSSNRLPYWYVSDFTSQPHGVDYGNKIGNIPAGIAQLTKVDGNTTTPVADTDDNPTPLKGAKFEVYKAIEVNKIGGKRAFHVYKNDDGYVGETTESDEHGRFTLPEGVKKWSYDEGNYYVIYEMEDHVPNGYAHAKEPWLVTVHYDSTKKSYYGETWTLQSISGYTDKYHLKNYSNPSIECNDHVQNFPTVELTKVDLSTVNVTTPANNTEKEVITLKNDTVKMDNVGFQLYKVRYPNSDSDWTQGDRVVIEGEDTEQITWTDQNGVLKFGVLSDGRYLLYERRTKVNYVLPDKPWHIWIQKGKISRIERPGNGTGYINTDTQYITNTPVCNLPSAGGMGTYWFTVIGAMMMAFAAAMVFMRRTGIVPGRNN